MLLDDEALGVLKRFPNLQKLDLTATQVTDVGLPELGHFTQLTELSLQQCRVTNDGLSVLKGLPKLTTLNVAFTDVTADGLNNVGLNSLTQVVMWPRPKPSGKVWPFEVEVTRQLAKVRRPRPISRPDNRRTRPLRISLPEETVRQFPHLQRLTDPRIRHPNLRWAGFDDDDLKLLRQLPFVQALGLKGSSITDEGLRELRDHYYITSLSLPAGVTDAGLDHIRRLPLLAHIDLSGSQITDVGLLKLKHTASLQSLNLIGSHVTKAGVAVLKEEFPNLYVRFDR